MTRSFKRRHFLWASAICAGLVALGLALPSGALGIVLLTSGLSMLFLVLLVFGLAKVAERQHRRDLTQIKRLFWDAAQPALMSDGQGSVLWANDAARAQLDIETGAPVGNVLTGVSADPDALAARLRDRAAESGTSHHRCETEGEARCYEVSPVNEEVTLWRIEIKDLSDLRDTIPLDLMQLGADGQITYSSPSLRESGADQAGAIPPTCLPRQGQVAQIGDIHLPIKRPALRLRNDAPGDETLVFLPIDGLSTPQLISENPTHCALEKMPVAIAHISSDGRFTYLNQEARQILRLRHVEGALLSDTLEGLGRPVMEWLADVATGRLSRATEVLRLHRDDSEAYLKVVLTKPGRDPQQDVVAVLSDVTELKSLEAKFTQSQKMQAIGQLAGGVAHDFNNLLTAISGHCDLLLLRHDRSDLDYPDLMQIQQNTNRAAALVRQLLALSRQQTLKFATLDLHETMGDVIHLLNRLVGEKITLTLTHGENVAPIRSDKRQFEQVLMNLVVNARDAMPMGGEIRIETEAASFPNGYVRDDVHLPPGDYTLIHITDEGSGIPQSLLPKVFDPFFTTKRQGEGTGLGLSTVYGIVKQSGGYIFIKSEEGAGTTFTLYFAAQECAQEAVVAPRREGLDAPALKGQRALVLLVEDEAPVRSFAARALELQGHRVIEADCGESALEVLEDPSIKPDFFVTDVIMPGLDGPSWIAQIRDRFPDTPVLFMSGYSEDSRVAAQSRISNASFLGKPFSLAEFISTVNTQLQRQSEAA